MGIIELGVKMSFEENMKHKPTAAYYDLIYKTVCELKPKMSLEIGSAWGVSTHAILKAGGSLVSVDKEDWPDMRAAVKLLKAESRHAFVKGDSLEVVPKLAQRFDFAFIDGSHIQHYPARDMRNAWELLKVGGNMLCDDIWHEHCYTDKEWEGHYTTGEDFFSFLIDYDLEARVIPRSSGFGLVQKK